MTCGVLLMNDGNHVELHAVMHHLYNARIVRYNTNVKAIVMQASMNMYNVSFHTRILANVKSAD